MKIKVTFSAEKVQSGHYGVVVRGKVPFAGSYEIGSKAQADAKLDEIARALSQLLTDIVMKEPGSSFTVTHGEKRAKVAA